MEHEDILFGSLGAVVSRLACDRILDEILIAEENGHSLVREVRPEKALWVGRCRKCGLASIIRAGAQSNQYGGILNDWLRKPCDVTTLMTKLGLNPIAADLVELK
jgi:hypothetical protein